MMTDRLFIPGSSWLYFKLYTGHKSADDLLAQTIAPLMKRLKEESVITQFFFIRYTDPEFHIRIRLHINETNVETNCGKAFRQSCEAFRPCMDKHLISNIVCDTYNRELERYGNVTITATEEIFHIDSECVIGLLNELAGQESMSKEQIRWPLALLLVDDLLNAVGMNAEERLALMTRQADLFKKEFGFITHTYEKQLGDKYRSARPVITQTMERNNPPLEPYMPVIADRCRRMEDCLPSILAQLSANTPPVNWQDYIGSLMHMTMNRLFKSKNRLHELVIYEFLRCHYLSGVARTKYAKNKDSRP
jgi:thiopeptide-type bacteriocin biosynthesis protein